MIINGDSLHELKNLEDKSVDAVITDPPYGYSFMGKDWDKAVPSVEIWQECLRVLKPGGWCMVMSAPRSDVQNAMISRLMEAGFRLDFTPIYWTYASGFPKALNIAGNLDKIDAEVCKKLSANIASELSNATEARSSQAVSFVVESAVISEEQWTLTVRAAGSTCEHLDASKDVSVTVPSSAITQACEQALLKIKGDVALKTERGSLRYLDEQDISALTAELIASLKHTILSRFSSSLNCGMTCLTDSVSATSVTTTESTTALLTGSMVDTLEKRLGGANDKLRGSYAGAQVKPAVEVVIVAMKPLSEKTYVDQALKNGKGITWLDDCRVPTETNLNGGAYSNNRELSTNEVYGEYKRIKDDFVQPTGRFPANLLVSDDVLNDGVERKTNTHGKKAMSDGTQPKKETEGGVYGKYSNHVYKNDYADSGSYSRYFDLDKWAAAHLTEQQMKTFPFAIFPKASKSEKNKGLVDITCSHPTVKPLKLMSYLITLTTREGDTVLDPFVGSGTTVVAAKQLGRKGVGIEREEEYAEIARARVEAVNEAEEQLSLV